MWPLWVYRAVGAGTLAGGTHLVFHNWKVEVALAATGAALPRSCSSRFILEVGKTVVHRAPAALRVVYNQAARGLGWVLRTRAGHAVTSRLFLTLQAVGSTLSAITLGYTIGAVSGTVIAHHIWGDRGARLALDFYTGKGKYGEYFDIILNVNTIWNAYFGQ